MLSQSLVNPLQASMGGLKKFGAGFSSYLSLLWYASDATATSTKSRVGPSGAFASAGAVCNGTGGTVAANVPAIHTIDSRRLMWNGPAYSNLFTGGPTGAEAKTLTVQKYCLQCVGGSVATSGGYGTATPSTPLVFTGPAGSVTFTPTDCTTWMLTAAGGYVFPYIDPGISSASAAGTTGLNGTTFPKNFNTVAGQRLLETFRGVPDGTELAVNNTFDANITGWVSGTLNATLAWDASKSAKNTRTGGGSSDASLIQEDRVFPGSLSSRFLIKFRAWSPTYTGTLRVDFGDGFTLTALAVSVGNSLTTTAQDFVVEAVSGATAPIFKIFAGGVTYATGMSTFIDNISIQKLNPAVGSLAVLVRMGAGSAEIPNSTTINHLTADNTTARLLHSSIGSGSEDNIALSSDGATLAAVAATTWSANEYHLKMVEFNGTKFRVGNRRYSSAMVPIDADIVWSHATLAGGATFDGSFNPLTALIEALNSTVPSWTASIAAWRNKVASESEVLRELHRKYPIGA